MSSHYHHVASYLAHNSGSKTSPEKENSGILPESGWVVDIVVILAGHFAIISIDLCFNDPGRKYTVDPLKLQVLRVYISPLYVISYPKGVRRH